MRPCHWTWPPWGADERMAGARRAPAAIFVAASLVTACGSSATRFSPAAPAHSATATPSGPRLSGTVETAADAVINAAFTAPLQVLNHQAATAAPRGTTCTQYAAGSDGSFLAPQFDITSNGHSLYFQGMVASGYSGPGTYSSDTTSTLTGTVSVGANVGPGQQPTYSIFRSQIGGQSSITVHDDGSGTFTFSDWGSDEVRGNTGSAASISGAVTWTCR